MKLRLSVIAFFATLIILGITSCEKTPLNLSLDLKEESLEAKQPKLPSVEDNYLVFDSIQHFNATIDFLEGKSRELLDQWEQALGFQSMRYFFDIANDEFEEIQDRAHLTAFKQKYQGKIVFAEDSTIEMLLNIYYMGSLLNVNGLVKIGKTLQYYDDEQTIIIVNGDKSKLARAKRLEASDMRNGILIIEKQTINLGEQSVVRTNCTNFIERERTDNTSNSRRRLRISAKCHVWTQPIFFYNGYPIGNWINFWRVITKAESHQKKWYGWKRRTTDFYETFSFRVDGNNTSSTQSFPQRITQAKQVETHWAEWERIMPTPLTACFTAIDYEVQGGSQNWVTVEINH